MRFCGWLCFVRLLCMHPKPKLISFRVFVENFSIFRKFKSGNFPLWMKYFLSAVCDVLIIKRCGYEIFRVCQRSVVLWHFAYSRAWAQSSMWIFSFKSREKAKNIWNVRSESWSISDFILGMKSADGDQQGKKTFSHVMKPASATR